MKRIFSIVLVLSLVLISIGCASNAGPGGTNLPPWVNDLPNEGELIGIGSAKQSTESMSMTTAEARARVSIARALNNKVQAMFVDYNLDAGPAGNQASTSMQEDVSRQVTNMNVSNSQRTQLWVAPDKTYWIQVTMKISDARNQLSSIIGSEEAAYAQFKAQQALAMMDAQLAKSEKAIIVDN